MRHRAAWRQLPALLDGALAPALEEAVRGHAAGCARCARRLAEYEWCDELVGQLPLSVVPLEVSASGERRLRGLARWTVPHAAPPPHYGLQGLAAAAAAAVLVGVVTLGGTWRWVPPAEPAPTSLTQLAYVVPTGRTY
jgi:anti-sigma factor RsiW